MSKATNTGSFQAAQRYRRAAFASIVLGTLVLLGASRLGYGRAGLVVYVVGALAGFGLLAFVRLNDSLALGDEWLCALERRTSHYAVVVFGLLGWVSLVGASLLDATGQREMTELEGTLLLVYAAFFLTWAGIYVVLRFRR